MTFYGLNLQVNCRGFHLVSESLGAVLLLLFTLLGFLSCSFLYTFHFRFSFSFFVIAFRFVTFLTFNCPSSVRKKFK